MKTLKISASKIVPFLKYTTYNRGTLGWKNENDRFGTHALFISSLLNNNVYSHEILWIYLPWVLYILTHLRPLFSVLRYIEVLHRFHIYPLYTPHLVVSRFFSYVQSISFRFGTKYYCPPPPQLSATIFGILGTWFLPEQKLGSIYIPSFCT